MVNFIMKYNSYRNTITNKTCISGNRLLREITPPFDPTLADKQVKGLSKGQLIFNAAKCLRIPVKRANKIYKNVELDADWLRGIWLLASKISMSAGTVYHTFEETQGNVIAPTIEDDKQIGVSLDLLEDGKYTEPIFYSLNYPCALRPDKIKIKKGKLTIYDTKLYRTEPLPTDYAKPFTLPVLAHLKANNYNKVTLQCSLAGLIGEEFGLKVKQLYCKWVPTKNVKTSKLKGRESLVSDEITGYSRVLSGAPLLIELPYLRNEALSLLDLARSLKKDK